MTFIYADKAAPTPEVARLRESLGASGLVFDRQPRDRAWSGTTGRESLTSTAIVLIGLARAGVPPSEVGIDPGRAWASSNELGVDLVDRDAGTTWRSIDRAEGRPRRLARPARALVGGRDDRPGPTPPRLLGNHETRPYEWAWSLFASAIEVGEKPPEHLA